MGAGEVRLAPAVETPSPTLPARGRETNVRSHKGRETNVRSHKGEGDNVRSRKGEGDYRPCPQGGGRLPSVPARGRETTSVPARGRETNRGGDFRSDVYGRDAVACCWTKASRQWTLQK